MHACCKVRLVLAVKCELRMSYELWVCVHVSVCEVFAVRNASVMTYEP